MNDEIKERVKLYQAMEVIKLWNRLHYIAKDLRSLHNRATKKIGILKGKCGRRESRQLAKLVAKLTEYSRELDMKLSQEKVRAVSTRLHSVINVASSKDRTKA